MIQRAILLPATILLISNYATTEALARIWTDSTGKHKIEADFVDLQDGKVNLRKPNGKLMRIPLSKLSKDDRKIVQQLIAEQKKAKLPVPPTVLTGDDGTSIEFPGGILLSTEVWVNSQWTGKEREHYYIGSQSCPITLGNDYPLVVITSTKNFTDSVAQLSKDQIETSVKKLEFHDAKSNEHLASGLKWQVPKHEQEGEFDVRGNFVVVSVKSPHRLTAIPIANKSAAVNDKVYVVVVDHKKVRQGRRDVMQSTVKMLSGRIVTAKDKYISYELKQERMTPRFGGHPIVNEKGELVAMHYGQAKTYQGDIIGIATSTASIRKLLTETLEKTEP